MISLAASVCVYEAFCVCVHVFMQIDDKYTNNFNAVAYECVEYGRQE